MFKLLQKLFRKKSNGIQSVVKRSASPYEEAKFLAKKPEQLNVIITLTKWYPIYERKDGKVLVFLDNDFSHWIPEECLEIRWHCA